MRVNILIYTIIVSLLSAGCKKWVEVESPATSVNGENVYKNDKTAIAVLRSVYIQMSKQNGDGYKGGVCLNSFTSFYSGLSSDEFELLSTASTEQIGYYRNQLVASSNPSAFVDIYPAIYVLNSAIEGIDGSKTLTPLVKQRLLGEAKFLRGFYYFYLVNLYGPIPLILTTDYTISRSAARQSVEDVYSQIEKDLKEAETELSDSYVTDDFQTSSKERTLPTTWAAKALLARVYLYQKKYSNAEAKASEVINHSELYNLESLNSVFLSNSKEAILQLQPVNNGWNTEVARLFVIPSEGPAQGPTDRNNPVFLSESLLNAFESGDQRKVNWINVFTDTKVTPLKNYYFPYKYKVYKINEPVTEYESILRLGELFLIRAEARANNDHLNAVEDLNTIRKRAGLGDYIGPIDRSSILNEIYHERRIELFSEWGHRWFDLKRTGLVNSVMSEAVKYKQGFWNSNMQNYPIPSRELELNRNLTQNQGY